MGNTKEPNYKLLKALWEKDFKNKLFTRKLLINPKVLNLKGTSK